MQYCSQFTVNSRTPQPTVAQCPILSGTYSKRSTQPMLDWYTHYVQKWSVVVMTGRSEPNLRNLFDGVVS